MINFINRATGWFYGNVLRSMIDPIKKHLPDCSESRYCTDGINVHFFREKKSYFDKFELKGKNVFISHGIADKNWRNAEFMDRFDYVFVSGPMWVDKLVKQGLSKDSIFIVGYTKLDPIFQGDYQKANDNKKRILWGPTHNLRGWTSRNASSHPFLEPFLKQISSEYEIVTAPHPANAKGNITMQSLVNSDVVISDCSSVIYEAWALGKPVVFPDWLVKNDVIRLYPNSLEEQIYQEGIGYHVKEPEQLNAVIERALSEGITKREVEFIDGIFPPELRGKSGKATADVLEKIDRCISLV